MASFSSSRKLIEHEVFLSFRGADTRNNFTSHLNAALCRQGIITFIDYRLERGEEIEQAILKAIQESRISIVVLSKDYASSPWCLDELVKIFECRDMHGLKLIPLFYHVNPSDVRNQTGSFEDAFIKHEQNFKKINMGKVQKWRTVLSRVANIKGEHITGSRVESDIVDDVVKKVLKSLGIHPSFGFKNLVGMQRRVSEVEKMLHIGSNKVCILGVGIWGMGGIGKTTLAKFVYQKYASQFEGSCFIENVCENHNLSQLRHEILVQLQGNTNPGLIFGTGQLRYKKLLIVLDNVNNYKQLELLTNEHGWFGQGSRIIITSRDRSVFQNVVDSIYEVEALTPQEALNLFSLCAFKERCPKKNYSELSNEVVRYAEGNPLALNVLGLFLCGKNRKEWASALKKLERFPNQEIHKMLKISYDGLDAHDQQIFLHVAFMFKGESINQVVDLLDGCEFSTLIGLRELADKSLVTLSNGKVGMHDLLQEMGRQIIYQESKEPGNRSRLWNPDDIYRVFTKNTGSEVIEGICLDMSRLKGHLSLQPNAFANMNGVKLLKIHRSNSNVDTAGFFRDVETYPNNVLITRGSLKHLPDELRLLHWQFCPAKSLPSNLQTEKLIEINLSGSSVTRLWEGIKDLPNLKEIKLRHCRQLVEMPNLAGAPNLQTIDCRGCISLVKVSSSITSLNNLSGLNLAHCRRIKNVPSTKCLKILHLSYCPVKEFPQVPTAVKELYLEGTGIETIPDHSIRSLAHLRGLSLYGCKKLKHIPNSIYELKNLLTLLCGPYITLSQFENQISLIPSLRYLQLFKIEWERIPSAIEKMSCLIELKLISCQSIASLPNLPPNLRRFDAVHCASLQLSSNSVSRLQNCWGKLIFADCISLNQNQIRCILRYVRRRILVLAHTPPSILHQEHRVDSGEQFVAIIPGNNIPKWIAHQRKDCSITISLAPNWFENFSGFVIGAVFEFRKQSQVMWMQLEIQLKSNSCDEDSCYSIHASFWYSERTDSQRERAMLWYQKDFSIIEKHETRDMSCYNEASFEFRIQDNYGRPLPSSMIKQCGVRSLYKDDKDEFLYSSMTKGCFEDYCNYVED